MLTSRALRLLLLVACLAAAAAALVSGSPPIDYLIATSGAGHSKSTSSNSTARLMPTLESIHNLNSSASNQERTNASSTTNQTEFKRQRHLSSDESIASRVLSIIRNSSHTHDNDRAAELEIAGYAWQLMESRALLYARERVHTIEPFVLEILEASKVSTECRDSIGAWLAMFERLEDWAAIMWNSWGDFPSAGLFEGSFTDLGSYKGCLSIEDNPSIGQAQYCTLDFEPIIPTRPRFHSIFKRVLKVDRATGQLTGGDFDKLESSADKPRSKVASHGYKALRFFKGKDTDDNGNKDQSEKQPSRRRRYQLKSSAFAKFAEQAHYFYYMKLRVGSCWPSRCSLDDIRNISQTVGANAVLRATEPFCTRRSSGAAQKSLLERLNIHQIGAILILAGLASITLLATILDIARDLLFFFTFKHQSKWISRKFNLYIDTYSICKNTARLFAISASGGSGGGGSGSGGSKIALSSTTTTMTDGKRQNLPAPQLTCLHGLKFVSMVWVIYGHTLLFSDYQSYSHPTQTIEDNLVSFWTLPTLNPNFSVDTFFVISGLLSSYIIFSLDVKFNGFLYTIARYIRLTPQLFITILLFFLLPLMGDGPLYKQGTEVHAERCMKNFWLNLLYLQSYINRQEICLIPSWWLSIEMTFHLISLFVIYLLIRNPRLGMMANWAVIIVMTLAGSIYHYSNGFAIQYLPSIPQKYEIELEQTQYFFHMPYPHAASFFTGLALGHVLAKGTIKRLKQYQLYLGWTSSVAIFAICLSGGYYWNLGAPYTQLQATVYYNLCQVLWPLSICWVILTCTIGQGGPVDSILSAEFFVPFGRITYMTYLSHMVVVYYYAASIQQTFEPNFLNMTYICVTNAILSIVLGTLLSLVYEAPLLNIQKLILQKKYGKVEPMILTSTANGIRNKLIIQTGPGAKSNASNNTYQPVPVDTETPDPINRSD